MSNDQILNEPSYFWWNDDKADIPPGRVIPNTYCSGLINIEANGRITAELHGTISWQPDDINENGCFKQSLCGLTIRGSQGIYLLNVRLGETHFVVGGLSSQQLTADYCLFGSNNISLKKQAENFEHVSVELTGLEAWLCEAPIKVSANDQVVESRSARRNCIAYELDNGGKIELNRVIRNAPLSDRYLHSLHLSEDVNLVYRYKLQTIEEAILAYQQLTDFIMLFIDCAKDFPWPTVGFQDGPTCRLYFERADNAATQVRMIDCWLTMPVLKPIFGELFSAWIKMCGKYGPGIYMYLGLRRGVSLYPENRFMNMIYGLEALHRSQESEDNDPKISVKISRILSDIQIKGDKRWLKGRLKNAHEPSLERRIYRLFHTLPLQFDEALLKAFAKRCAAYRNDISHFGTTRETSSYSTFVNEILIIVEALELLYLIKIFHMMGVSDSIIGQSFNNGFQSHSVVVAFWRAKLTKRDPFKPQQS